MLRFALLFLLILLLTGCSQPAPDETPFSPIGTQPTLIKEPQPPQTSVEIPAAETEPPQPTSLNQADSTSQPAEISTESINSNPTSFPIPENFSWLPVANGLQSPVGISNAGDGSTRLFVIEQSGKIRIIKDGILLSEIFLNISDRVGSRGSEQGLLGLAFHPDYAVNGYFYVNYTDKQGTTIISRFKVSDTDPALADPASEKILLTVEQPYGNHNGGSVAFGPDGYLYLGLGDGGSGGDPHFYSQSLDTLLGKILRIDVNHGDGYSIPEDNPFPNTPYPEIWGYGLRNPWRFSFDSLTGDFFIGDVGQNQWEEINFLPANYPGGVNFGWNYYEGTHTFLDGAPVDGDYIFPVVEYDHNQGCSVTGGVVYRGNSLPEWYGVYLFGDFCTGTVWGLIQNPDGGWIMKTLYRNIGNIASFGVDENGEVYLVDLKGTIYQLQRK